MSWQVRRDGRRPSATRHGREIEWTGSLEELVEQSASITLLTTAGGGVTVGEVAAVGRGGWSGTVLQAAPAPDAPSLGSVATFGPEHVQTGTLR